MHSSSATSVPQVTHGTSPAACLRVKHSGDLQLAGPWPSSGTVERMPQLLRLLQRCICVPADGVHILLQQEQGAQCVLVRFQGEGVASSREGAGWR